MISSVIGLYKLHCFIVDKEIALQQKPAPSPYMNVNIEQSC